jgi:hypothetical protein
MTRLEPSKDAATTIAAAIRFVFQDFYPTYSYILKDDEARKKNLSTLSGKFHLLNVRILY